MGYVFWRRQCLGLQLSESVAIDGLVQVIDLCDICCAVGSLLVQFCGIIWVLLVLDCLASKPPRD